jgi:hypothetical protein
LWNKKCPICLTVRGSNINKIKWDKIMKKIFILTFLIFFSNGLSQNLIRENEELQPFGLQDKIITSLNAEQGDYGNNIQISDYVFAGTTEDGVFETSATSGFPDWVPIGLEDKSVTALTVQHWGTGPIDGLTLFAAVSPDYEHGDSTLIFRREVYLPTDTNWVVSDSGLDKNSTRIYVLNSYYFSGHEPPQPILAGGSNGLFQASPIDYFWSQSEIESESSQPVISAIDIAPHWWPQSGIAWAAGYSGLAPNVTPIALRSTDQGLTWKMFPLSSFPSSATSVVINTRNPDSVYIAGSNFLYLTPDNGENWEVLLSTRGGGIGTVALDPLNPENVFAGGFFFDDSHQSPNHGVFLHSTDGGKDWSEPDPVTEMQLKEVTSIVVSRKPNDDYGFAFIGTEGTGVWRYEYQTIKNDASSYFPLALNHGWNYDSNLFPHTEKITDSLRINDTLYFGLSIDDAEPYMFFRQSANKVFVLDITDSTEAMLYDFNAEIGESWELPEEFYCNYGKEVTLVSKCDTVETPAGTFYNCYHFTHSAFCADAGITDTWLAKGTGKVRYKEIFFAGEGNFVLSDYVTSIDKNSEQLKDFSFRLFQNYPNPFNPSTKIEFVIPKSSFVSLKIYDLLGREVASLVNEEKNPGSYEVEFSAKGGDAYNLSSGTYFYQIKAGDFVKTKKMIYLK